MLVMSKKARTPLLVKKILKAVDYVKGLNKSLESENSTIIEEVKICL